MIALFLYWFCDLNKQYKSKKKISRNLLHSVFSSEQTVNFLLQSYIISNWFLLNSTLQLKKFQNVEVSEVHLKTSCSFDFHDSDISWTFCFNKLNENDWENDWNENDWRGNWDKDSWRNNLACCVLAIRLVHNCTVRQKYLNLNSRIYIILFLEQVHKCY